MSKIQVQWGGHTIDRLLEILEEEPLRKEPEQMYHPVSKPEQPLSNEDREDSEVHSPYHYRTGEIECIDYLRDNLTHEGFKGYLEGCAKKYLHRFKYKGKAQQDIEKAQWYLDQLKTALMDEEEQPTTQADDLHDCEEEGCFEYTGDSTLIDLLYKEYFYCMKESDYRTRKVASHIQFILEHWLDTPDRFLERMRSALQPNEKAKSMMEEYKKNTYRGEDEARDPNKDYGDMYNG